MMTTLEAIDTPMAPARRYATGIVRLQDRLRFAGLPDAVLGRPLCRLEGYGDGLITVSALQSQLPDRYMRGILGFRLAQFLQLGWMDAELVYRDAMAHEPLTGAVGPEAIHTVALTEAGRIVGYIGAVGAPDPVPLPLDAPDRRPFPAEAAHRVDLAGGSTAPGRTTHHVYEIKRFVRHLTMGRGVQRDRVPWHLILSLGRAVLAAGEDIQVLLGDSRETGAIRHLRLIGFAPVVVDDTKPSLPRSELMWPSYEQPREKLAKPFIGTLPTNLVEYMNAIESALRMDAEGDWQPKAIARLAALHDAIPGPGKDTT